MSCSEGEGKEFPDTGKKKMKAVLLDMDGVVLDSKNAWFKIFNRLGGVSAEDFDENYWGIDLRENLARIGEDHNSFCAEELDPYLDLISPLPGIHEVLEGMGMRMGLITNTTLQCTIKMLESISVKGFFEVIVSSDMVKEPKPHPEPVEKGCEELGIDPAEAYMVGDSEEDMIAGKRAGCTTIGLGVDGDIRIQDIRQLPDMI